MNRTMALDVPPGAFDVPEQPGEIVLTGEGSALPARDVVVLSLRELKKLKQPEP